MTAQNTPGFSTRAVHAGSAPEELTGAVIPPLYLSTTYHPHKIGELRGGYDYSRGTNPTRDALQEQLAALEGGRFGISDVVAEDHLSPADRTERGSYVGCIAGALSRSEYLDGLAEAGFAEADVTFTHEVAPGMHGVLRCGSHGHVRSRCRTR